MEGRMWLMSSAFLPATKPTMQCRAWLAEALPGYEVTQNSGMKQSVHTTSKKPSGQKGLLKAKITCRYGSPVRWKTESILVCAHWTCKQQEAGTFYR